jgi:hypothetical protein
LPLIPALADVGTAGLFADGVKPIGADDPLSLEIACRHRRPDPNPVRFGQNGLVRAMCLFGVTRTCRVGSIDQDDHRLIKFRVNWSLQPILTAAPIALQAAG